MSDRKFNKLIIFYFSGTGNALHVAKWISEVAKEKNIESELVNISKLSRRKDIFLENNALIGFCSPTHGFNFPPIMFHFLLRFPRSKNNKAFIMNTRAGMKMGKFYMPGLSGLAQFLSAMILSLKSYRVIGMHPIDLPSNWISFHPGLKTPIIDSIYKKRKIESLQFAQTILEGKRDLKALRDIIQDIIISPIALGYYLVGRFILAKSLYASQDCTKCNLCIQKCPIKAIKTIDSRPFWTYKCESCMQCINICPERAIETAHGFLFVMWYFITSVLIVNLYELVHINLFIHTILPDWISNITVTLIKYSIMVFLFILFYWIFHFALRFRFFERIIVYTSLTKWKFWRRYRAPQ